MVKPQFAFVAALCISNFAIGQSNIELQVVGTFPSSCIETSGLENSINGKLWSINDSGNQPELFLIDSQANVISVLSVEGATNVDWEDLARSEDGRLFVGDFGNNGNARTNLCIYVLPNPDLVIGNEIDTLGVIHFSYPDQSAFPPATELKNFDCESMFWWNGSLFLISKNRGTSQYAKLYQLPDQPGTFIPTLLDSFNTGYWITGADINPPGNQLFLQSYQGFWVFDGIQNGLFFQGTPYQYSTNTTQREAVVYSSNSHVYMSDEYQTFNQSGGKLYSLSLDSLIDFVTLASFPENQLKVGYEQQTGQIWLDLKGLVANEFPLNVKLSKDSGQLVYCNENLSRLDFFKIPVKESGIYILDISSPNLRLKKKILAN